MSKHRCMFRLRAKYDEGYWFVCEPCGRGSMKFRNSFWGADIIRYNKINLDARVRASHLALAESLKRTSEAWRAAEESLQNIEVRYDKVGWFERVRNWWYRW